MWISHSDGRLKVLISGAAVSTETGGSPDSNAIARCRLGNTELSEIVYEQRSSLERFKQPTSTGARRPLENRAPLVPDTRE